MKRSLEGRISNYYFVLDHIAYDKHYVSITVLSEYVDGEPYNAEPDKAQNWYWCDPHTLPEPFFLPSKKAVNNWLNGTVYSD